MKRFVVTLAAAALLAGCGTTRSPIAPTTMGAIEPGDEGYAVTGAVVEQSEDAARIVASAAVELSGEKGTFATETDAEGEFRFERVPAGTWTLTVTKLGYNPALQRLVLAADTRVDIALDRDEEQPIPRDRLMRR